MEGVKNYFDEFVRFSFGAIVTERENEYVYVFRKNNRNLNSLLRKLPDILMDYCLENGSDMYRTLISPYKKDGQIVGLTIPRTVPRVHVLRLFNILRGNGVDLNLSFEKYYEEFDRESEVSSMVSKINRGIIDSSIIAYPSLPHLTNLV